MKNTVETIEISEIEYKNLQSEVAELKLLVEHYKQLLMSGNRVRFGSKSEQTDINQLSLFCEQGILPPPETRTEEITYKRKKKAGKREEELSNLPVERIDYELCESQRMCPECGEIMCDIGVETRRELKLIPAKVVVVEHKTHTYACRECEKTGTSVPFIKADAPTPLIAGSLACASLVAHIAVQKYAMGMPLYRLENGFNYDGVNISRQTMSNWVIMCSERYLEPLYNLLKTYLLRESVLHADETIVQVLHEPGRSAKTKSYEWVYRTSGCSERKIAIYEYKETRSGIHPKAFLKGFVGLLHTDGYQVYHDLPPEIMVIGCWSHARRKFEDILKTMPKESRKDSAAERGAAYINALFALEREFAELLPNERLEKRQKQSKPLSDAFFAWAGSLCALPKSPLGTAVNYAFSQRKYLENVFLDGRAELSNNRAERTVKPFVMGRKAWLFSNTPSGARASSVFYSIIETAKENNLHLYQYLEFLLEKLPNTNMSKLETLLPWSDSLPQSCFAPKRKETPNGEKK